jgi:heterodisulfide reductase subunit A-like polyferredoxin
VNDKGNAVIGTRYGRFNGMFGANEMSICKQDLILQEELNCETSISVHEAASQQSLSGGQGFFKVRVYQNAQVTDTSVRKMEYCAIVGAIALDHVITNDF